MAGFETAAPDLKPLLGERISRLGLKLEGSPMERYVTDLYRELEAKGLKRFRPPTYFTDEWGCPSEEPIIGIPFYLADANLARLEMRVMYDEQVLPRLRARGWVRRIIVHHKINMFGRGESDIEAEALDLTARGRIPEVGITAHEATISFRVTGEGADENEARRAIEPTLQLIRERFRDLIVGEATDDVAEGLVAQLERTKIDLEARFERRKPAGRAGTASSTR